MILVDTSVLIDALTGVENGQVAKFRGILDTGTPFGISSFIYLEVLQGAKNDKEFKILQDYLGAQKFYHLKNPNHSYQEAATIYYKCRKKGITVSSTIDCLIAQTVIENNLYLLHHDSDFDRIAKVVNLKLF